MPEPPSAAKQLTANTGVQSHSPSLLECHRHGVRRLAVHGLPATFTVPDPCRFAGRSKIYLSRDQDIAAAVLHRLPEEPGRRRLQ